MKTVITDIKGLIDKYNSRINEVESQDDLEAYSRFEPDILEEVIEDLKQLIKNEVERCL